MSDSSFHSTRRGVLALGAAAAFAGCASTAPEKLERTAELDELFPELSDQRGSVLSISHAERAARRTRLARLLAERDLDALVCEGGATMSYLSGVAWGKSERAFALIVLADGTHFWICPAFEAAKAKLAIEGDGKPGGAIVTWEEHEYAWKPLAAALRERRVLGRVAFDPQIRFFLAERTARELGRERVLEGGELVGALRGVKDAHELELLRKANELTQRAIVAVSQRVKLGMNGDEVAELMAAAHRKLGMSNPWCLALVGAAAAYPHGDNHTVELARDEFLLVDTGASFHGYQSDNTRTWVVDGAAGEARTKAWHTVRDSQQRAFDAVRPGATCASIDAVARGVIEAAGYGSGYAALTHRLGHGIGMEGHEDPYFDGGSEVVLAPGMTLSDEPGIYLYGRFGVRLEDILVVTESGADHFGSWQRDPSSPA